MPRAFPFCRICGTWPTSQYSMRISAVRPLSGFNLAALVQDAVAVEEDAYDDLETAMCAFDESSSSAKRPRGIASALTTGQSHRNSKRAKKRQDKIKSQGHHASDHTLFEHVQLADEFHVDLNLRSLPVDASGYAALRLHLAREESERDYSLRELIELGFKIIEWDGRYAGRTYLRPACLNRAF